MAFAGELLPEVHVVFDHAVMYDSDLAAAIGVRVSVDLRRFTVSGPPGVSDAYYTVIRLEAFFQCFDPYRILIYLSMAAEQGDTAGIVPSILQPLQAVYQNRLSRPFPYVANDSAHDYITRLSSGMLVSSVLKALIRLRLPIIMPGEATTLLPMIQCSPSIAPILTR